MVIRTYARPLTHPCPLPTELQLGDKFQRTYLCRVLDGFSGSVIIFPSRELADFPQLAGKRGFNTPGLT